MLFKNSGFVKCLMAISILIANISEEQKTTGDNFPMLFCIFPAKLFRQTSYDKKSTNASEFQGKMKAGKGAYCIDQILFIPSIKKRMAKNKRINPKIFIIHL